jgi:hypothetical protein
MNKKIIILAIALSLIPAVSQARGFHASHAHTIKVHTANPFGGYKHQRLKIARKGQILVYNP